MAKMPVYEFEVRHDGLHKYRVIRGTDRYGAERQAKAQVAAWNEIWTQKQQADAAIKAKAASAQAKDQKKSLAAERTKEAQAALSQLDQILIEGLKRKQRVTWDSFIDNRPFPEPLPSNPVPRPLPKEPQESNPRFEPVRKWYYFLFSNLREQAKEEARQRYIAAHADWATQLAQIPAYRIRGDPSCQDSFCRC